MGAPGKTNKWGEKRAQGWEPHVACEWCEVGRGREMSLEPVRENEGVCGEKERRGVYKAEL